MTGGIVNAGYIGAGEAGWGNPSGSSGSGSIETGTKGSCFVIADRLIPSSSEDSFTGTFVIGGNGKVYSDMSLYTDVTLPSEATLTIPEDVVLTIPTDVTFTNNGAVEGHGEIDNYGSILGNQPNVKANEMVATISVTGNEGGSVAGGGDFATGSVVAVTATPEEDYHFLGWMENEQLVSDSARYEFQAMSDRNLTAVFEQHLFGEWLSGNGTHTRRCMNENCNVTETEPCTGGIATCSERAVCEICGGEYGELNASNHAKLVKVEAKSPTQTQEGNITYWYCEACGRYFSDEALTHEITVEDTTIPAAATLQTGDNERPFLWGILMLIGSSVIVAVICKNVKYKIIHKKRSVSDSE